MKTSRIFLLVLSVMLLLSVPLVFSACNRAEEETCAHQWGEFETVCEPTCTSVGVRVRSCVLCGKAETEEIPVRAHSYISVITPSTCKTKGYTTYICICGDTYVEAATSLSEHTYVETVTPPTCTTQGYTTHTCTVCGYSYNDTYVDPVPHQYTESVVTPPNCTEQGYTTHICAACGDSYDDTFVPALGHDLGEWQDDGSSACQREGCGEVVRATSGLSYVLREDDTYYVTGLTDETATDVIIPGKINGKVVSGIADRAFFGMTGIVSVNIPSSVTYIGEDAFFACTSLSTVRVNSANTAYLAEENSLVELATGKLILARGNFIPDCVTTIGTHAFAYSTIESIEIPAGVTAVEYNAFYRVSRLTEITVADGNAVFTGAGNCLIETATGTLVLGCKGSVIPDDGSVRIIGAYAFAYIRALTGLSIPDSVTAIRENAFIGCVLLTEEMGGAFYVDGWLIDCDESISSLIVKANIRGFSDDSLNGCTALTHIYYSAYVQTWEDMVHRFDGWNDSITIVCDDGQIVDGVPKAGDDTSEDVFD